MKRTVVIMLTIILTSFSLVGLLLAQQPGPPPLAPKKGVPPMMRMLNLTDEQASQISDLRLQLQKEMLPLRSKLITKRNELKLLLTADKPDQGKINQKVEEISKIRTEIQKKQITHRLKIRSLLTEEQRKIFDARILSGGHGGHHGGNHHSMMGAKPGKKGHSCR